jgi:hypothetical protein
VRVFILAADFLPSYFLFFVAFLGFRTEISHNNVF